MMVQKLGGAYPRQCEGCTLNYRIFLGVTSTWGRKHAKSRDLGCLLWGFTVLRGHAASWYSHWVYYAGGLSLTIQCREQLCPCNAEVKSGGFLLKNSNVDFLSIFKLAKRFMYLVAMPLASGRGKQDGFSSHDVFPARWYVGSLGFVFHCSTMFPADERNNSRGNYHNSICCLSSPDDLTALIALILDIRGQYRFNSTGHCPVFFHAGGIVADMLWKNSLRRRAGEDASAATWWAKLWSIWAYMPKHIPDPYTPPPIHTYLKGHDPFAVKQSMSQSGSSGRI